MPSPLFRMGFHTEMSVPTLYSLIRLGSGAGAVPSDVTSIMSRWGALLGDPRIAGGGIGFDTDGGLLFGDIANNAIDLVMQCALSTDELRARFGWDFTQPIGQNQVRDKGSLMSQMFALGGAVGTWLPCRVILWPVAGTDYFYADAGYDPGFFPPLPPP